ncbi:unnamed protein product [Prunus armeniaca]
MTGPPSSSYPGQVPPPAAVISPENEEKSSVSPETSPASFSIFRPPFLAIKGLPGSCRIRRILKRSPGYSGNTNPEVRVLVTVRSCDRERSDRPIWTKLAGRAS